MSDVDYCDCDIDDFDPPSFTTTSYPIARKAFKCDECAGPIRPGEKYRKIVGKWCGDMETHRECCRCQELREWATISMPCFCAYGFGTLHERVASMVEDVAPKVDGFVDEYQRRIAAIKAAKAETAGATP